MMMESIGRKAVWLGWGLLVAGLTVMSARPLMADTEVEFTGTLVTDPCEVDIESEDQTIEFWPISTRRFINHTDSTPVRFSIWLRECDLSLGNQVSVTFIGTKEAADPRLFAVNGTAEGVALAIADSEGRDVEPGASQRPVVLLENDNELQWQATIRSTAGQDVQEGEFESVVTFSLEYE